MNRIATIFLAVTASLFFVGCYNDFDTPAPAKVWTDADFSDSKIISIKEPEGYFRGGLSRDQRYRPVADHYRRLGDSGQSHFQRPGR